jgi:GT2 family glycosyltransferase
MSDDRISPRLGVGILTYGDSGVHLPLLETLWREGVEPGQVLVVHNPAREGEADPPLARGVELFRCARNGGYAGGMNVAVERLLGRGDDLLLLLTHDARLRPGAVPALLGAAAADPGYGVLAPALKTSGTEQPFSFGGRTSPNGVCSHLRQPPPADSAGVAACDWVDGGTMLLRREALEAAGRFDERFWGYCEESDLCLRVERAGMRIGVVLAAVADQDPGGAKRPGAWAYLLTRNGTEYARRAVGLRGVIALEARAAQGVVVNLLRVLSRLVRRRPGGPALPWAIAVGTFRGGVDFLRGRWGPPPPGLPGIGDVANA